MEIDFDTLIYLIFTIIFIAVGALGKKKRPAQTQPVPSSEEEMQAKGRTFSDNFNSLFEDVDRNLDDIESSVDILDESEHSVESMSGSTLDTPYSTLDKPVSRLDEVPGSPRAESYPERIEDQYQRIMHSIKTPKAVGYKKSNAFVDEFRKDFDARKAVIYSELINPKYF